MTNYKSKNSMELLNTQELTGTAASITFAEVINFATTYSEIIVIITGESTAALAIELILNQITSGYAYTTSQNDGGTDTDIYASSQSEIVLATADIVNGAAKGFSIIFSITKQLGSSHLHVVSELTAVNSGSAQVHGNTTAVANLSEIKIETSTSTFAANTQFQVFGVRK